MPHPTHSPDPQAASQPQPWALTDLLAAKPRQVPVTVGLVLLNALVLLLMLRAGAGWWHTHTGVQLQWGANFGPATQDGQWWRLFTALFIHFGVLHLGLNMWALWDVGRLMERLLGGWRYLLLYLGSGVVGNLLSLVVQGNRAVSGGASGAVFSLYGALIVLLWRSRTQVHRNEFGMLLGTAVAFTALTLGMGFVIPGIDNAAHIGGLLAGAVLGLCLMRPLGAAKLHWQERAAAAAVLVAAVVVLVTRIPQPAYRYGDELRARAAIQDFLYQDQRITRQWGVLLNHGPRAGMSFDQLAGAIDNQITANYERSFEQLTAATPESAAPSAKTLQSLQDYASARAKASRDLTQGLRTGDRQKIRKALQDAGAVRQRGASAPTP